jgi:hypothetical protein
MPSADEKRVAYERAVLSEIRMLLDYLAADFNNSVSGICIKDRKSPGQDLDIGGVLVRLVNIETQIGDKDALPLDADDFALLLLVRDALVQKTRPASGLTIAYTAMVSGNRRGDASESRASLAHGAYSGIALSAKVHRWMQRLLLCIAVLATVVAVWESARVSLGRSLLQNLDALRVQQASITQEKAKLEAALSRPADGLLLPEKLRDDRGQISLSAFSLCDHPYALAYYLERLSPPGIIPAYPRPRGAPAKTGRPGETLIAAVGSLNIGPVSTVSEGEKLKIYGSPQERDVCERDSVLATNFAIVHHDLRRYRDDWPAMVGSLFAVTSAALKLPCLIVSCAPTQDVLEPGQEDVEFVIAPALLVWGNYALPVLFGLLGSVIYVILDFYGKIRSSRLDPRDTMLGPIRLVLGLVMGTSIGLFFSAAGPVTPGAVSTVAASLTVSASGLAFLAGFGVEGVFSMLDTLVRQVFASHPPGK